MPSTPRSRVFATLLRSKLDVEADAIGDPLPVLQGARQNRGLPLPARCDRVIAVTAFQRVETYQRKAGQVPGCAGGVRRDLEHFSRKPDLFCREHAVEGAQNLLKRGEMGFRIGAIETSRNREHFLSRHGPGEIQQRGTYRSNLLRRQVRSRWGRRQVAFAESMTQEKPLHKGSAHWRIRGPVMVCEGIPVPFQRIGAAAALNAVGKQHRRGGLERKLVIAGQAGGQHQAGVQVFGNIKGDARIARKHLL